MPTVQIVGSTHIRAPMKAILQRVTEASVAVEGDTIGAIGNGLVILFCAEAGDSDADAEFFARKIARMRIFQDHEERMNLSLLDVGGQALVVSQFTLAAQWRKGNRPGFSDAAPPEEGRRLYRHFRDRLAQEGVPVASGRFGTHMKVHLLNDGPVTIVMDSRLP